LRHGFIVAQIALAFVLLSGAGLLGISLKRAMAVSPGFRPDHVLTGQISLPWNTYRDDTARLTFIARLIEEGMRIPGVLSIGVINNVPLSGNRQKSAVTVKGYGLAHRVIRGHYSYGVTGNYFAAMGILLQQGRFIESAIPGDRNGCASWIRTSLITTGHKVVRSGNDYSRVLKNTVIMRPTVVGVVGG
jgi:hypothetical protein